MINKRSLPLIMPMIAFIGYEIIHKKPELIYISGSFLVILHLIACARLIKNTKSEEKWFDISIFPFLNTVAVLLFSLFLPKSFNHILYILGIVLIYFYYRIIYYYLEKPEKYENNSLENLSSYANFINFYFAASSVYGMQVLLGVDVWKLILAFLVFTGLSIYQGFWAAGFKNSLNLFYIAILCVILVQIAWAISFLSLSYYVLGLILSMCYYVAFGLTKYHLLGILNKRIVKLYLFFGFTSILAVLLTARWL
jgi:hypothetical protein